jgi:acyl-CoA synthetase (AMP-forming)/AMP-acid ligase II
LGEIWVTGPSKAQGYWQRPGQSEETFRATLSGSDDPRTYLRTGDLGALRDGRLFIVGRIKDLIIARGMNLYPQDLEHTAETSHPALRRGGGAAFGVPDENGERVVLVHELDRFGADVDKNQVISSIRRAVAEIHGVTLDEVCLTGKGQVPKTTSGKVRRRETQRRYLAGELTVHAAWATPTKGATQ